MSRLGLLDKNWLQELKSGSPFFRDSASNGNTALLHRVWERVRDEFLPQYIAKHPGERPFCWWRFAHGTERPIIGIRTRSENLLFVFAGATLRLDDSPDSPTRLAVLSVAKRAWI